MSDADPAESEMAAAPRHVVVVGGGITGLAAAHRLVTTAPAGSIRVTVLEASPRFGGWIRTEPFAGRPVDFGPDSLLVRTPWATELARELGIEDELVAPGAGGAHLLLGGELRPLPSGILAGLPGGPMPFVRSGLLGPLGLLRAALDLVLPANAPPGDESIGALVRRRLGRQALERVIDPLLGGVHAGRCDDLSLASTAPQIAAAARADRSLIRGLRRIAPPARPAGEPPAPVFKGPRGGMERLVDALVEQLGDRAELRTGVAVTGLTRLGEAGPDRGGDLDVESGDGPAGSREPAGGPGRIRLHVAPTTAASPLLVAEQPTAAEGPSLDPYAVLSERTVIDADGVVLAIPAGPTAHLVGPHAARAATTLLELRYATVAHIALAYDPADLPALPSGTGFLVPRGEGTLMTACTFLDQKWPERRAVGRAVRDQALAVVRPASSRSPHDEAPEFDGSVVIKCSAGRSDDTRAARLPDEQLAAALHAELATLLGFAGGVRPLATKVVRAPGGLPQYAPGHGDRIDAAMRDLEAILPGLSLAGAAYRGTSVPICIREGRAAADAQLTRLTPPGRARGRTPR